MDMEQLKLILDMVGAAGDGAFALAVIFFVKEFVSMLLVAGIIIFLITKLYKVVARVSYSFELYRRISDELELDTRECDIYSSDSVKVINKIKELNRKK